MLPVSPSLGNSQLWNLDFEVRNCTYRRLVPWCPNLKLSQIVWNQILRYSGHKLDVWWVSAQIFQEKSESPIRHYLHTIQLLGQLACSKPKNVHNWQINYNKSIIKINNELMNNIRTSIKYYWNAHTIECIRTVQICMSAIIYFIARFIWTDFVTRKMLGKMVLNKYRTRMNRKLTM